MFETLPVFVGCKKNWDQSPVWFRGEAFALPRKSARTHGQTFVMQRNPVRSRGEAFAEQRKPVRTRGEAFAGQQKPDPPHGRPLSSSNLADLVRCKPFVDNRPINHSPPALPFNKRLVFLNTELKSTSVNTHWEIPRKSIKNNRDIYVPVHIHKLLCVIIRTNYQWINLWKTKF